MRTVIPAILGIALAVSLTSPATAADRKGAAAARAKLSAIAREQGFEAMSDTKLKSVSGNKSGRTAGTPGAQVENLSVTEAMRSGLGSSRPDTSASRHSVPTQAPRVPIFPFFRRR